MTDGADWISEARRRIDAGESVIEVARDLGRSADGLRYTLDIGGAREQKRKRVAASRLRDKADVVGVKMRHEARSPVLAAEERMAARAYADPAPPRPLTLPKISLPDLGEPPLIRRLAPVPRVTVSEGAERIRQIHLSMKRRGLIPERSDLVDHFTH